MLKKYPWRIYEMAKLKWVVEFSVDETWVADGFDLTDERAKEMLARDLSYAYGHELDARLLQAPLPLTVAKLQGYPDSVEVDRVRKNEQLHKPFDLRGLFVEALAKLDSVAFLSKEGDTDDIKARLRKAAA
jgi:hypothetical protein